MFEQPCHRDGYRSENAHITGAAESLFLINNIPLPAKVNRVVPLATLRLCAVRDVEFDGLDEVNAIHCYQGTGSLFDSLAGAVLPEAVVCSVIR